MQHLNDAFSKAFSLPMPFINADAITNAYYTYDKLKEMSDIIMSRVNIKPVVAIVCGSGLGAIANLVEDKQIIPYEDIPEFPRSTVHGHKGNLVFGHLNGLPIVCMQGRFHPFEGYSLALCCLPIKIFKIIGIKLLILTNAAGGINQSYNVGDLMVIKDHASYPLLSLNHPLIGPNDERFGPRFTPVNNIYSKKLRDLFLSTGKELGIDGLREGIYGTVGGPTYETVTDAIMLKQAGVDCVGMSTSHEASVAAYCGLKVLAFSIVTDKVTLQFDAEEIPDHDAIVQVANKRAKDAELIVSTIIKKLKDSSELLD